jgi:hypothetical protein
MRWKFKKLLVSLLTLFSKLTNKPIITSQQKKKPKEMHTIKSLLGSSQQLYNDSMGWVVFWGTPNNYHLIDKDVCIEYRKNRKNF